MDPPAGTPEFYADNVQLSMTPYTTALSFSLSPPHPMPGQMAMPKPQCIIRMSPEHAKILALLLRGHIKGWERDMGVDIQIPHQVYNQVGISPEDW